MGWRTSPELSKQAHDQGASNGAPYVFLLVTLACSATSRQYCSEVIFCYGCECSFIV